MPRLAAMKGIIFDNGPEILAMMSVIAPLFLISFAALVLFSRSLGRLRVSLFKIRSA